jgi:hypothetical protein
MPAGAEIGTGCPNMDLQQRPGSDDFFLSSSFHMPGDMRSERSKTQTARARDSKSEGSKERGLKVGGREPSDRRA